MSEPFIAEVRAFAFNFSPRSWAFCQGQLLSISQFQTVFALVGSYYGGDGRASFGVPDLRGRLPMGMGNGPGMTPRNIGEKFGMEMMSLTTQQMASHDHAAAYTPSGGGAVTVDTTVAVSTAQASDQTAKAGDYLAAGTSAGRPEAAIYIDKDAVGTSVNLGGVSSTVTGGGGGGTVTVQQNGAGHPFPLSNPTQVVNFCMALDGLFPSRS